jgi:hypothetical protein
MSADRCETPREILAANYDDLINAPVQSTPYVEAYLVHNGLKKISDGVGGEVRFNPACGTSMSWACNHCGKSAVKLQWCGACGSVGYCDRSCQKAAWKEHKPTCLTLRKTNAKIETGHANVPSLPRTTESSEKLMKWITQLPGFSRDVSEMCKKSPYQGDQVPIIAVHGGSNPFVAIYKEITGASRDLLLEACPYAKHFSRPLSEFEKDRNAAMHCRTVAYVIVRGARSCTIRGRVAA